jgi:hypothetical protein
MYDYTAKDGNESRLQYSFKYEQILNSKILQNGRFNLVQLVVCAFDLIDLKNLAEA